jgi:hypothetical protein
MANDKGRAPGPDESRRVTISVRVMPYVRDALEKAAKLDRRTVASMADILIEDGLRAKGLISEDDVFS